MSLLGLDQARSGWREEAGQMEAWERMGRQDLSSLLPGASASSTQWPSPAGSCNNRARPAVSSLWTG